MLSHYYNTNAIAIKSDRFFQFDYIIVLSYKYMDVVHKLQLSVMTSPYIKKH